MRVIKIYMIIKAISQDGNIWEIRFLKKRKRRGLRTKP